jgi:hypothetical protein
MKTRYKVGDEVEFNLANRKAKGVIVEDRGNLGFRGAHLWRIRVEYLWSPSMDYELSEDEFELLSEQPVHA